MAFKIEATDAEDDPLTYRIEDPGSQYFQMNSASGEATLRTPLDREVKQYITFACFMLHVCARALLF